MSEHIPKTALGAKADLVVKDQYIPDLSVESKDHILMLLIKANAKIQQLEAKNKIMREALERISHETILLGTELSTGAILARQTLKQAEEV